MNNENHQLTGNSTQLMDLSCLNVEEVCNTSKGKRVSVELYKKDDPDFHAVMFIVVNSDREELLVQSEMVDDFMRIFEDKEQNIVLN